MSGSKSANTTTSQNNDTQVAEVLYQKLGGQWYAFSMINDEMFMSPVEEEKIFEIKCERESHESV